MVFPLYYRHILIFISTFAKKKWQYCQKYFVSEKTKHVEDRECYLQQLINGKQNGIGRDHVVRIALDDIENA